uniref:Uncharacterized protein n=1 Tax=Coptotermes formosanus TaxID=36987 RepID=R4UWD9_COPFO|nr:hypothetical protein [Coptotermes formosanus]
MSEQDLPSLIAAQRQLLMEKTVIAEMLKKVRSEMQKLQVEQLQLDSMIMTEDGSRENTSSSVPTEFVDMDSAEKVNEEKLDLTVSSSMNNIFCGQFSAEEEEEEEEEDENRAPAVLREEFILPL